MNKQNDYKSVIIYALLVGVGAGVGFSLSGTIGVAVGVGIGAGLAFTAKIIMGNIK